jgi:hypothetical protein
MSRPALSPAQAKSRRDQLGHTAFEEAFQNGTIFRQDGDEIEMTVVDEGFLTLPTGQICVAGPFFSKSCTERPFCRRVVPGRYRVTCAYTPSAVACLKITFQDTAVERWEMAEREREAAELLASGDYLCFSVDGGEAAFCDVAVAKAIYEIDPDEFFERYEQATHRECGPIWMCILAGEGYDFVATMAGRGDGGYSSYWGLDRGGHPVCLVADFAILVDAKYSECTIPLAESVNRPLSHPWLESRGLAAARLSYTTEEVLLFSYEGKEFVECELVDKSGKHLGRQLTCGPGHYEFSLSKSAIPKGLLKLRGFEQYECLPVVRTGAS